MARLAVGAVVGARDGAVVEVRADLEPVRRGEREEGVVRVLPLRLVELRHPPRVAVVQVRLREAGALPDRHVVEHRRRRVEFDALQHSERPRRHGPHQRRQREQLVAREVEHHRRRGRGAAAGKGELGGGASGGDVDHGRVEEDADAERFEAFEHRVKRCDVARGQLRRRVDDPHERRRVVEHEGRREVLGRVGARRLVARDGQLEVVEDEVAGQVHVRREAVRADVDGELVVECGGSDGIGAAADAVGGLEEAERGRVGRGEGAAV